MHYLSIDNLIVGGFLLLTLLIGLLVGRGIKDIREYAVANKMFGTVALTLTFLATNIAGASVFDTTKLIFEDGILITAALLTLIVSFLFTALFVAPHAVKFTDCLTMGDIVGTLYGPTSKPIAGFLGLFTAFCLATMELSMLGEVGPSLLGWSHDWTIIFGGIALALYTAHGGIKAVVATDVFQFLVLLIGIPVLAVLTLEEAGGLQAVINQVPQEKLQILHNPEFTRYLGFALIWLLPLGMIDPCIIQRFLMGKSRESLRNQYLLTAVFDPSFQITLLIIGLAGLVLYPQIDGLQLVPHIVHHLLPVGARGILMAGLLGIVLSTIDSYLHAMGLTAVHDVWKPLAGKRFNDQKEVQYTRYATVLLSLGAIFASLYTTDFLGLLTLSLEFTGPLLMFPLLAGMMGLKPDKYAFYTASGVTLLALIIMRQWISADQEHFVALFSTLFNGFVFFGVHIYRNQGLAIVSSSDAKPITWYPQQDRISSRLKNYLPTPQRILKFSQNRVARYGVAYVSFGLFCCFNFIFPYFMWSASLVQSPHLMLYIRLIGATLCGLLIVKDKWHQSLLPYLPTFWHFTLLYCIPFTSTVMFLLTQGSVEWLINVAITIMFLIVLVDWVSFLLLTVVGIALGFLFYTQVIGPLDIKLDFTTGYLLVYQGIFATLIGLLFARKRQQRTEQQQRTLQAREQASQVQLSQSTALQAKTLKTLEEASIQKLLQIVKDLQALPTDGEATDRLQATITTLVPIAFQLQGINVRATDYLRLEVKKLTIEQWLSQLVDQLREKNLGKNIHFIYKTQHKVLICDPEHLTTLVIKSIASLQEQPEGFQDEEKQSLLLGLEDTTLHYLLPDVAKGYIKKVKALRIVVTKEENFPALAPSYQPNLTISHITTSKTSQALEQLANERIVKAHYGYAEVAPNTLCYVIPIDLQEVRPKDMDKSYMELGVAPVRANDHYKSDTIDAQAQEQAFFEAVAQRSSASIGLVKTALELIKWYHGPVARYSGEPFYLHPLTVAQIVLDYSTDEPTILGALLHDTVEDTSILLKHIGTVFGEDTAAIVDTVTHLQSMGDSPYKIKLSGKENLKMLERIGNTRGLYVKLADRMHNMRTIDGHRTLAKQQQVAEETMQFYVSMAEQLGLVGAAAELKERSSRVLKS